MFKKYNKSFSFSFTAISLIIAYGSHILAAFFDAIELLLSMTAENLFHETES